MNPVEGAPKGARSTGENERRWKKMKDQGVGRRSSSPFGEDERIAAWQCGGKQGYDCKGGGKQTIN